jgi:hypothetical protein
LDEIFTGYTELSQTIVKNRSNHRQHSTNHVSNKNGCSTRAVDMNSSHTQHQSNTKIKIVCMTCTGGHTHRKLQDGEVLLVNSKGSMQSVGFRHKHSQITFTSALEGAKVTVVIN